MPLADKLKQKMTVFCEVGFLIFDYHMILFTDLTSPEQRQQVATSVGVLTFAISAFIIYATYKPSYNYLILWYSRN